MKIDPVKLINDAKGPYWICGIARELWPVLIGRLDELDDVPRMAVEHYASEVHPAPIMTLPEALAAVCRGERVPKHLLAIHRISDPEGALEA